MSVFNPFDPLSLTSPPRLDWEQDGADWPHRERSRFVKAAALQWHVQHWPKDAGLRVGVGEGSTADRGASPDVGPILLLHGAGGATHSWRDLAPRLTQYGEVWSLDLPGHGFSDRPVISRLSLPNMAYSLGALLRSLGASPRWIVGHSAGAAIAVRLVLDGHAPNANVVSLNGAFQPFGGVAGAVFPGLAQLLALNPFAPRVLAMGGRDLTRVKRLLGETGSSLDARGLDLYGRLFGSPAHIAGVVAMMSQWRLEPLLRDMPKFTNRLVLLAAEHDRAVPVSVAERTAARVTHATQVVLPDLGHLAHEEKPELVADTILAQLAKFPN